MKVLVFNEQDDLLIHTLSVAPIVESVLAVHKAYTDEVGIYFVSEEKICKMHEEFFNDPSPTDCISFPIDAPNSQGYQVLGEIFICPKAAIDYLHNSHTEKNIYLEVTLYLVHGLLHLLGFDDIDEKDQEEMRDEEKKILDHLHATSTLLFAIVD